MITVCIKSGIGESPYGPGTPAAQALRWLANEVDPLDVEFFEKMFSQNAGASNFHVRSMEHRWKMLFNSNEDHYEFEIADDEIASLFVIKFNGQVKA